LAARLTGWRIDIKAAVNRLAEKFEAPGETSIETSGEEPPASAEGEEKAGALTGSRDQDNTL
jgi:acetyl-CoA carboxylase alpha subunit